MTRYRVSFEVDLTQGVDGVIHVRLPGGAKDGTTTPEHGLPCRSEPRLRNSRSRSRLAGMVCSTGAITISWTGLYGWTQRMSLKGTAKRH